MQKDSWRIPELDFMRIIACLAVIVIHCSAIIVVRVDPTETSWLIANAMDSFSRWAVPVFVMISGSLLLKKAHITEQGAFFKKRLPRIIIPLIFWALAYWVLSMWTRSGKIDLGDFATSMMVGDPYPGHLYFLFLISGLYILTPLLSLYVNSITRNQLFTSVVVVLTTAAVWQQIESSIDADQPLNAISLGLPYIGYYLLGYYIFTTKQLPNYKRYIIWFVASSTIIAVMTLVRFLEIYPAISSMNFYGYITPMVMISSGSIFVATSQLYTKFTSSLDSARTTGLNQAISALGKMTFGVYLIHMFVVEILVKLLPKNGTSFREMILLITVVPVLSFVFTAALRKIRFAKYILP